MHAFVKMKSVKYSKINCATIGYSMMDVGVWKNDVRIRMKKNVMKSVAILIGPSRGVPY